MKIYFLFSVIIALFVIRHTSHHLISCVRVFCVHVRRKVSCSASSFSLIFFYIFLVTTFLCSARECEWNVARLSRKRFHVIRLSNWNCCLRNLWLLCLFVSNYSNGLRTFVSKTKQEKNENKNKIRMKSRVRALMLFFLSTRSIVQLSLSDSERLNTTQAFSVQLKFLSLPQMMRWTALI